MYKHLFHNAVAGKIIVANEKIVDCNYKAREDLGYSLNDSILSLPLSHLSADGSLPARE